MPLQSEPTLQDYSSTAIKRAVLRSAIAHPLTVLPSALAVLTAMGGAVMQPGALFMGIAMVLASLGLGSFATNFFFRSQTFADRYVKGLERRRDKARSANLMALRQELVALGNPLGVKAYDELVAAYDKFRQALRKRQAEGVALDVTTLEDQADATRDEGLAHLRAFASNVRALAAIDAPKLKVEAEGLRVRLARLPKSETEEAVRQRGAVEAQLQQAETRLKRQQEAMARCEEILAAADRCEAALETGALDIGSMQEVTARFLSDTAATLHETVSAARAFNEALGAKEDDSKDRIYDRAPEPESAGGSIERPRERERE
ncbi:MAG: hypothetical protein U0166_13555 [Acidobacteriota bacterium]